MTEKEKLLKQKEEAMSRLACLDYEDTGGSLPDDEDWQAFENMLAEAAVPSEMTWDSKAKRTLKEYRLEKAHGAVRLHWRVIGIAAALLVGVAGIVYAHCQESIHNIIMTITDQYFTVGGESVDESKYFDLAGIYAPQYIPAGFHLVKQTKTADYIALEYHGRDKTQTICFQQAIGNAVLIADTSAATEIRPVEIRGVAGQIALNPDKTALIYWGTQKQFIIRGTAAIPELMAMAESVVFMP